MDGENSHYSISMSSWNYELSSSIAALLKRVENHNKPLPLVDILYKLLSSRFGKGWVVVAAVDSAEAIKYYFFLIEDAKTNADIYCFKPDVNNNSLCKQDTTSRITIPPGCSMAVLDTSFDKLAQADIIALVHEVLHTTSSLDDKSVIMRTRLIDRYDGLFHVICSESSLIVYQMDGQCMYDYIFMKHGTTYILIWESTISEKEIDDHRLSKWYETNLPFFALGLFALAMLMYLITNVRLSEFAEKCTSCDEYSDENLYSQNVMIFTFFVISMVSLMNIFFIRNQRRRRRQKEDLTVMDDIIKKNPKRK